MRQLLRLLLILSLALSGGSCQEADTRTPAYTMKGVTHVVICWLNDRDDPEGRAALLASADTLRKIPGVITVAAGGVIPSDRPVVDSSYDIAFVASFANQEALKKYVQNPEHIRVKNEVLDRYVRRYVVYDFSCPP